MSLLNALSFSAPLLLTTLASLPVLYWLMRATPPAPARVQFPAFVILRRLQQTEETPDRTPWWLLLLRLAAAAMIIIALAGPVLNAPPPSASTGPLVLIVDDSWAAASAWRKRKDAIKLAAAQAEDAGRPAFLITTTPAAVSPTVDLLTPQRLRETIDAMTPQPFRANRGSALNRLSALEAALAPYDGTAEIRWYADGVADPARAGASTGGAQDFLNRLKTLGDVTVFEDSAHALLALRPAAPQAGGLGFRIERIGAADTRAGAVVVTARDGREIARAPFALESGEDSAIVTMNLPLALQNDLNVARIDGVQSAGATYLADARDRRSLVGLVGAGQQTDKLLDGVYYVQRALQPFAEFEYGSTEALIAAGVSSIVMNDVGRLRIGDVDALSAWIEEGGILIRFAGPTLAEAAQDGDPDLLPVPLRGGGRAFGGALTWETPQPLSGFSPDGPFADVSLPDDIFIRRQVLAAPGGDTSLATWASLEDGTPLVTGARIGGGAVVLFHVTATPSWSDLPISGVFIEMLRKLTALSVLSASDDLTATGADDSAARFAPIRILNGFGRFDPPPASLDAIRARDAAMPARPETPPGFYGSPDAPIAINAVGPSERLAPLSLTGATMSGYDAEPPRQLAAPLIAMAIAFLLIDALLSLIVGGRLRLPKRAAAAAATTLLVSALTLLAGAAPTMAAQPLAADEGASPSPAQPLDAPIDTLAADAALKTRLAFVRTGDPTVDRLSETGLAALSRELFRRTAIEPAEPVGVDPDSDDLSVYPFLYWPMTQDAVPSEAALENVENFMRFGGLVMFDTRDDERAITGLDTPERIALRAILSQLDVPPLAPLPDDHVLKRSFYLLPDLPGRMRNNPVWVQAAGDANDAVTPLIIGGRDWAGAWATNSAGAPALPIIQGGPRSREMAYRAGINVVMVAFTGNYKSDQVHTPILLERLGR
ncbi:MAG: DUF4159 domain-containing protein [Pseudomonadota bacterium]